ncbi:MAG TPA: hypothetical protein VN253_08685 [Kofleriaceae bacterium]|nr:hypothetical protein [Kofleriaceae bacterium]
MIVIYGTRFYGKVDSHGDQYQVTKFFHVYYVPLIPVDTLWVTRPLADGYQGHAVRLSGRSVLAGYARVWGPLAALIALSAGGAAGAVAAAVLGALCALSWTWRSQRDPRERRRSDFHLLACGTRCDPLRMPHRLASEIQGHVAECWAQVADGRTPEDVARLGAANLKQAVFAYASLRLAARLAPREPASTARAASERVLDAIKDVDETALEGGPYRAAGQPRLAEETVATD